MSECENKKKFEKVCGKELNKKKKKKAKFDVQVTVHRD